MVVLGLPSSVILVLWLRIPCFLMGKPPSSRITSPFLIRGAHMWAMRMHNPCRLGGPQRQAWGRNQYQT